ncbi:UNVERIFIED_CONTAM: hypothetical protein Slati_2366800 [Sesamum latifolium]|uniref:ATP-dependent DNA helicase n=1 Tax=Sesamum latifolium TaxID=2727402 RepID=A0AAW2WAZ1_9LAMI
MKLQRILNQCNPFVSVFRQLGQRSDLPQCRLIIKQQAPNQHQYALPTASQVAAIIVDGEGIENLNNRDIMIEAMDGCLLNIQDIVGYYDPLQYPLLLPHELYHGLQDCLHSGETNAGNVGHRIVLPSSFIGSPRDMYQRDKLRTPKDFGQVVRAEIALKEEEPALWVSAPEAFWRIFEFTMSRMYPSVIRLQVHLPNQHSVSFEANERLSDILADEHNSKTMLTEFFKINGDPALAEKYLHVEFPQHFRWIQSQKTWIARTSQNKGPRSFEELLTINGVTYTTFKEAAQRRGLLQEDDYVRQYLHEACSVRMPASLRRLFGSILIFCQPAGVWQLWDEFYPYMVEDYAISSSADTYVHINRLLLEIRRLLHCYRRQLSEFDLPPISEDSDSPLSRIIQDELSVHIPAEDLQSIDKLNGNQKCAFDAIKRTISHNQSEIFFIDGPGGSGKTFLYRAILAHLRVNGHIVIATATSGIAATLLPGGRTAHSRFKIPLKPTADSFCKIDKQSDLAELIRRATAVIWDEAPMANRYAFEPVNKTFQDIMENNLFFGGKTIKLGGDFRQVLPVVKGGSLGDGVQQSYNGDFVQLPQSMIIPWEGEHSIHQLIDSIFPNMIDHVNDANYMYFNHRYQKWHANLHEYKYASYSIDRQKESVA